MQTLTGKPELMKRLNITLIYRALMELGSATRRRIAEYTHISTTTVRSLLEELLERDEIMELMLDASSGGRRATRYVLCSGISPHLCLYFERHAVVYKVCDLLGAVLDSGRVELTDEALEGPALALAAHCKEKWDIRAIGLGVPGVVEARRFYISSGFNQWVANDLGDLLGEKLSLPVVVENDLNAIALGYVIRHGDQASLGGMAGVNMVYIHFEASGVGAGVVSGGQVVRGGTQFAGELGFMPFEGDKTLDQMLLNCRDANETARIISRLIAILCCVTNPALIVMGGELLEEGWFEMAELERRVWELVPEKARPELRITPHCRDSYLTGLSHLTVQELLPRLPF